MATETTVRERRPASPVIWQSTIVAGVVAIVGAITANLIIRWIGLQIADVPNAFEPLANAEPTILVSIIYGIGAVVAFTLLRLYSGRPWRTFAIIAAVVFVLSFIPMLGLRGQDGTTAAGIAILSAMHVASAIIMVGSISWLAGGEAEA
ncbi:MAG: DUF6069 family protein [Thermomicrobiales bacterium]